MIVEKRRKLVPLRKSFTEPMIIAPVLLTACYASCVSIQVYQTRFETMIITQSRASNYLCNYESSITSMPVAVASTTT